MKLRTKTLLSLLLITAISFGSALLIRFFLVIPKLTELEAVADRKDVERLIIGFDMVRSRLNLLAYDYATLDRSYAFFEHQPTAVAEQLFPLDLFIENDLNLILLADRQRRIVWSRVVDLATGEAITPPPFDLTELSPYFAEASDAFSYAPVSNSGLILTSQGVLVFASTSVLRSNLEGPSPGTVLIGRFIDAEMRDDIREAVKLDFTVSQLPESQRATVVPPPLEARYRDEDNHIDAYLRDVENRPVIQLQLQLERRNFDDSSLNAPMFTGFAVMLLSWIALIWGVNGYLVQPIQAIGRHLIKIRDTGDYSLRLNSSSKDEIGVLSNECDRLIAHIHEQETKLEEQAKRLRELSNIDPLTGLANRRRFDQLLQDYWAMGQREHWPLAILFCDVDHFKAYNDNYGHQQGDNVLTTIAQVIDRSILRKSELPARYGGEEFVVLLSNTDEAGAQIVAERIHANLKAAAIAHEHSPTAKHVTISIGIASVEPSPHISPDTLVSHADEAVYAAKDSGRNTTVCYSALKAPVPPGTG